MWRGETALTLRPGTWGEASEHRQEGAGRTASSLGFPGQQGGLPPLQQPHQHHEGEPREEFRGLLALPQGLLTLADWHLPQALGVSRAFSGPQGARRRGGRTTWESRASGAEATWRPSMTAPGTRRQRLRQSGDPEVQKRVHTLARHFTGQLWSSLQLLRASLLSRTRTPAAT